MREKNVMLAIALATGMLACLTDQADAHVITSPVGVVGQTISNFGGATFGDGSEGDLTFVMDGSGLPAFTSGVTNYNTYIGANPAHASLSTGVAWGSESPSTTGDIDFDLGSSLLIEQVAIWNQGIPGGGQSIMNFTIFTSTDAAFSSPFNAGTFNAADVLTPSSFAISQSVGQYVRLQIKSNFGASLTTLGEIVFDTTAVGNAVPEPITATTLGLMGLGVLGMATRRAGCPPHR